MEDERTFDEIYDAICKCSATRLGNTGFWNFPGLWRHPLKWVYQNENSGW